ncbi:DNA/RNA non-specific endonuclease [Azospirillum argentinense]
MFGRHIAAVLAVGALALVGPVQNAAAAPTDCPQHFLDGQAPDLVRQALSAKTRPICYSAYALLHSGVSRTPLWSAEHLTADRLAAAREMKRKNTFHPDPNLPPDERAELDDYKGSGFDRGHMSPSGDMPNAQAQHESFSLANMIPQNRRMNQIIWEQIESATRDYAVRSGELYVVTGPIYQRGATFERINGRVIVPTHAFKAVYDPAKRTAGAYVVENIDTKVFKVMSIAELEQLTGISVFPALPPEAKATAMALPTPRPRR